MKNVLIVGASSGIGFELARSLSKTHAVRSAGRRTPDIEHIQHVDWDAASEPFPDGALPEELDSLVYAPGSIRLQSFNRLHDEHFREDFELNLVGAVRAIRAALPALKKGGTSSVVLFSTVAVSTGIPMHACVAAAKGAVEGLTRSLAAELAPQVRVNAVAPSLTNTPLASGLLRSERQLASAAERHPLGRIGQPQDIAAAVRFLLSPDASWVTGQVLHVDGGMSSLRRFS
jgi:NAD(P)-dependent dehydrogenase (short-subunit alcohol dehydrogenase family)